MKKQECETMSSFNRRFASFYYNMPKEIQPLENAAKLYYATTFPPQLSLLLLERKSVTLQHMFIDCLEVEENLRMYKKKSDQDSGDKMENKLDLVEKHKQKKTFSEHLKPSHSKQRNDQPNDVKEDGSTNMFLKIAIGQLQILLVIILKRISVCPYMMNMRMNAWILYL